MIVAEVPPEALIGALATVVVAVLGGAVTLYAPGFKQKQDQRRRAEELEARYRRSLLTAAHDLQSRLYNIAEMNFLAAYWREDRFYAETSTIWLIGQYLGWVEIFRRDAELTLSGVNRGDQLLDLLERIRDTFATDKYPTQLRIFRSRQSAIAELMISDERHGTSQVDCIGYATFAKLLDKDGDFRPWFDRTRSDLEEMVFESQTPHGFQGAARVVALQHALVDLIQFLDEKREGSTGSTLRRAQARG